jgi:5-bromo-4-chloroindolyl phosphate hydrolysis protein
MADKPREWQSTIVWGIVMIFFGGMSYKTLQIVDAKTETNAAGIVRVEGKSDANRERMHKNELVQTEINTKLNDIPELKKDVRRLTDYIMQNWEFKDKGKQ